MSDIPGFERRTKIVCTIGPATSARAPLRALLERGMNVARLNFSHGNPAEHETVLAEIRVLSEELGIATAVLQDLAGPKVRIGTLGDGSVDAAPRGRVSGPGRPPPPRCPPPASSSSPGARFPSRRARSRAPAIACPSRTRGS